MNANDLARETYIEIPTNAAGQQMFVRVHVYFETDAERDAFIASFPKSLKVKASRIYTLDGKVLPIASFYADLRSNDVNKGVNETGVKRARKFLTALIEQGLNLHYAPMRNAATVEDFLAATA